MAAARLFTPEAHGLNEAEMMSTQTAASLAAVWPEKMYSYLVGSNVIVNTKDFTNPGKQAIAYETRNKEEIKIALATRERLIYGYSFWGLGNSASLKAKDSEKGKYHLEGDAEAPERASIHAVEEKIGRMAIYREELSAQGLILKKFIEALHPRHIGLQRMGSESAMRHNFDVLTHTIIANMLSALGDQKGWTPEQHELAREAIAARMLADRTDNRHLGYARLLCASMLSYGQEKSIAFAHKIALGEWYILENGPKTIV